MGRRRKLINSIVNGEPNEKGKFIPQDSLIMELNILELPIFQFTYYKKPATEYEEVIHIFKDSNNNIERTIKIFNPEKLPRQLEQDICYGLAMLLVKKNGPIKQVDSLYDFKTRRLYFSIYELLETMGLSDGGRNYELVKDGIRRLANTDIYSYGKGAYYDKEKERHITNEETKIKIITEYHFSENETNGVKEDINWVEFGTIFFSNLQREYFKFLDKNIYFQLSKGICRKLYGYLERHRYDNNWQPLKYIKRRIELLGAKIPIEYKYPSRFKSKIEPKLKELMDIGYLTDYEITDDFVYFYFGITKEDRYREEKRKELENKTKKTYLRNLSDNLLEELLQREVDEKLARKLVEENNKWDIIKYCLYVDKQLWLGKRIESIGRFLYVSINQKWPLSNETDILEYIEKLKMEEREQRDKQEVDIKEEYRRYLEKNFNKFKAENPELYEQFKEQAFIACKEQLYPRLSPEEQQKFDEQGYEYPKVKKALEENLLFYLDLKLFEDYRIARFAGKEL